MRWTTLFAAAAVGIAALATATPAAAQDMSLLSYDGPDRQPKIEAAARRHEGDVVHISAPEMEALHREKALQPVNSPHLGELIDGAVPAHREWVATLLSVWVPAYNTNLVKKDELPKTYRDLPTRSGTASSASSSRTRNGSQRSCAGWARRRA